MPALAIASALVQCDSSVEPVLVGARRGVEASLLPRRPFRFHLLPAEPLYRRTWWRNARWAATLWPLAAQCRRVLRAERPALVVGTGGYAAAPLLLGAWASRIPLALQEQNAFPGLTTRWFARRARQVHLGFPEAEPYLRPGPNTRIFALGNPITPPDPSLGRATARAALGLPPAAPVVLAFGGSQGARRINAALAEVVDAGGLDRVTLLWGTGEGSWERYGQYHDPPRRLVRPFWDPIGVAYAAADVAVTRSGAMTTAELCAFGVPAILIPLPTAAADHQTRNAQALAQAGAATHLPESALTGNRLLQSINDLLNDPAGRSQMAARALARGQPDAARKIAEAILALMR